MIVVQNLEPNNDQTAYKDYEIKFPQPFGEIPNDIDGKIVIVATIELASTTGNTDRFCVNTANITQDGFTARVSRVDGQEGWRMQLQLNYMASTITVYN